MPFTGDHASRASLGKSTLAAIAIELDVRLTLPQGMAARYRYSGAINWSAFFCIFAEVDLNPVTSAVEVRAGAGIVVADGRLAVTADIGLVVEGDRELARSGQATPR